MFCISSLQDLSKGKTYFASLGSPINNPQMVSIHDYQSLAYFIFYGAMQGQHSSFLLSAFSFFKLYVFVCSVRQWTYQIAKKNLRCQKMWLKLNQSLTVWTMKCHLRTYPQGIQRYGSYLLVVIQSTASNFIKGTLVIQNYSL